jgi:hypothetical protein
MLGIDLFGIIISLVAQTPSSIAADTSKIDQALYFFISCGQNLREDLLIQLFSLLGVWMLWKQKKLGFYIYLLAECFLYFQFAFLIWVTKMDYASAVQLSFEMIWPIPFDIAFIILYACQLKFMPKYL